MKYFLFPVFILFSFAGLMFAQTAPIPTKSREFSIAFEFRTDHSADPVKEVELMYSLDHGIHWHSADRQKLEVGKFTYRAETDGEYWFAFRTITLSGVTKQAAASTQIRVLVDATPPKLSFTATQQESGALLVVWKAEDRNFQVKRPDFALSVSSATSTSGSETAPVEEKHWMPMNIDGRNVRATESGWEGSFVFWAPNGVSKIELRGAISDIAGNRVETIIPLTIKPVQRETESPPDTPVTTATITPNSSFPDFPETSQPKTPPQNAAETTAFPNASVPLTPPKPVRMQQQSKRPQSKPQPSKSEPSNKFAASATETEDQRKDQGGDQEKESPSDFPQEFLEEPSKESSKEQQGPILLSPDGEAAAISTSNEFQTAWVENKLAEELLANMGSFFEGGIQTEVSAIAIDKKNNNAAEIKTAEAAAPTASAQAMSTSASKPFLPGSITGITLNTAAQQPQIVVKWNVGDAPWSDAQVDVFRGAATSGPWMPIAINLRNAGEYWWFLTPEDLKPYYISVRIRSLHGGVNSDITQAPIQIDPKHLPGQSEPRQSESGQSESRRK